MNKEELQRKLIELQIINKQLIQLQQQLSALEAQSNDIKNLQKSLEEIEKIKPGTKILAPLSSGILIDAELKNNKEVTMALGANTTVKKSIPEAKNLIKDQEKQLELILQQLKHELQQYTITALQLEKEISQAEK